MSVFFLKNYYIKQYFRNILLCVRVRLVQKEPNGQIKPRNHETCCPSVINNICHSLFSDCSISLAQKPIDSDRSGNNANINYNEFIVKILICDNSIFICHKSEPPS